MAFILGARAVWRRTSGNSDALSDDSGPDNRSYAIDELDEESRRQPSCSEILHTYMTGAWFGAQGTASKQDVVNEWINIAIICGVSATCAASGLFVDVPELHADDVGRASPVQMYLVVWCFATLAFLTATVGYVALIIGGSEMHSQAAFLEWAHHIGWFIHTPLWVALAGAIGFYFGVVVYFVIRCGAFVTMWCVLACALLVFVPVMITTVLLVRSVIIVRKQPIRHSIMCHGDPDQIYEELRMYYVDECGGHIGKLVRHDFIHRFRSHGEAVEQIAGRIYDSWINAKIDAMLRDDPGF